MPDENRAEMAGQQDAAQGQDVAEEAGMVAEADMDKDKLLAELEQTRRALKRANAEAAERRKRLKELEEAERKRQEAELSEKERLERTLAELQAERDTLLAQMTELRLRSAVERVAVRLGFRDPEDVYHLADLSGVEVDDDGKVNGIEAALKALAKAKPYLLKQEQTPDIDAGKRGRAKAQSDLDTIRRRFGL